MEEEEGWVDGGWEMVVGLRGGLAGEVRMTSGGGRGGLK